jgi:hypothetical protein
MRQLWAALILAAAVGCGQVDQPSDRPMLPITRVPTTVRRSAIAKKPGVRFHTAWKLPNGSWQLRGNDLKGVAHEIRLSADGVLLQIQ